MKKNSLKKPILLLGVVIIFIMFLAFKDDIFYVKPLYEDAYFSSKGISKVKINNKWRYIDITGKIVI